MVTREPRINELIAYLSQARMQIQGEPKKSHVLRFSRPQLDAVRDMFARMIRQGEKKLHILTELVCRRLFVSDFDMEGVVIGEVETTRERFTLTQPLSRDVLYQLTDLDLGNRQVRRLRFDDGSEWSRAMLVANFIEYQPREPNPHGVHKIISRIKAEEELWNKVVDEIFRIDELVARDKKLRHLSRYVKDVFGLKIVVGDEAEVRRLHDALLAVEWTERELAPHRLEAAHHQWQFFEIKDYLGEADQKQSGWQAMKSVLTWGGETFELQIQAMSNYHRERERLTRESHTGFKRSRESVRQQIAADLPLFGFYQALLRWLFQSSAAEPPTFDNIDIVVT
jgi:hypothetical protein